MWNKILNCEYPANPVTHATIKFSKGKCSTKLPDSNNQIELAFANKTLVGALTKESIPGMAVCMNVDSGNGTKYSYVVAFLQTKNTVVPEAYIYLGKSITIKEFQISEGSISIWWLWESTEDDTIHIPHITCRNFSLINNQLVDEEHENAVKEKLKIAYDTIYTHSVKTGMWNVKWNSNRADAYNNTTGDTTFLYCTSREDLDDNNEYYGDSDLTYFRPDWYSNNDYQMLAIVGPYVSFLSTYDGSGGAHPIYGNVLCVSELGRVEAPEPQDTSTAPYDTTERFEKMIRATKNLRETDKSHAKITDIFPETDVFNALMQDSIILAHLPKFTPKNLRELSDSLDGECEMDFSYLLESFAIKSIHHDKAVILFGLTHGCEVEKGNFTTIEIELPIPDMSKKMFEEAVKNKTTIEEINPAFLAEQEEKKQEARLKELENAQREEANRIREQKQPESLLFYRKGDELLERHQYKEAILQFIQALKIYPDRTLDFAKLWIHNVDQNSIQQAFAECNELITNYPDLSPAYFFRGLSYVLMDENEKAISDYTKAISLANPCLVDDYFLQRVHSYLKLKNYESAIKDAEKIIGKVERDGEALTLRGICYMQMRAYEPALQDFKNFFYGSNDPYLAQTNMGWAYLGLKKFDDAIQCFNGGIGEDSIDIDAYIGLALTYFQKKDNHNALRVLDGAIKLFPDLAKGMEGVIELEQQGYYYNDEHKSRLKELFAVREKTKNGATKK
jgi:tetratricopeptide (TPR) repeat protein